jgi:D-glycero-D-manno-heptose 1,7-bisphosphate phosphatase
VSGRPAVFVDRDGVITEPVPHPETARPEAPFDAAEVALVPGAAAALARLRDAGRAVVVVSNQPAAAKGTTTMGRLQGVHQRAAALLAEQGVVPDRWCYCYHHPSSSDPELGGDCPCRKPAPGMLFEAAEELGLDLPASWMIGDSDEDVEAGRRAGCRTALVEHPGSAHRRSGEARADLVAADLWDAARAIAPERGAAPA